MTKGILPTSDNGLYGNLRGQSMRITCRQHRQGQAHHTDEHHVYSGASAEGDGVPALSLAYRTGRASALRYLAWNLGAVPRLPARAEAARRTGRVRMCARR
jgi:hypothetical protein